MLQKITFPRPIAVEIGEPTPAHREIICRTLGLPSPASARIDAEGWAVYVLDPRRHDPFSLFDRLKAAVDRAAAAI